MVKENDFSIREEIRVAIESSEIDLKDKVTVDEILEDVAQEDVFFAALGIAIHKSIYDRLKALKADTQDVEDEFLIDLDRLHQSIRALKL